MTSTVVLIWTEYAICVAVIGVAVLEAEVVGVDASGRITTEAYPAEHDWISRLIDELEERPPTPSGIDPERAVAWLTDLKHSWEWADEAERANIVKAIYRRIVVEGDSFVGVELTEEAKAIGLAVALPQSVALARPARLELTTFWSATRCSIH